MRKFALALLATSAIIGCAGSSGSSKVPYAGHYAGTFNAPSISDSGTLDITISSSGVLYGNVHDTPGNKDGIITGSVSDQGNFAGSIQYPTLSANNMNGTFAFQTNGQLVGNLSEQVSGSSVAVAITLTKQ